MSFKKVPDLNELEKMVNEADRTRKQLQEEVIADTVGNLAAETEIEKQLKPLTKLLGIEGAFATDAEKLDPTIVKTAEGKKITRIVDLAQSILSNLSVSPAPGVNKGLAQIANESLTEIQNLQGILTTNSKNIVNSIQRGDKRLDKTLSSIADTMSNIERYTIAGAIDKDLALNKLSFALGSLTGVYLGAAEQRAEFTKYLTEQLQQSTTGEQAFSKAEADVLTQFVVEAYLNNSKGTAQEIIESVYKKLETSEGRILTQLQELTKEVKKLKSQGSPSEQGLKEEPPIRSPESIIEKNIQLVPTGTSTESESFGFSQVKPDKDPIEVQSFSGPGKPMQSEEEKKKTEENVKAAIEKGFAYATRLDIRRDLADEKSMAPWINENTLVDLNSLDKNVLRVVEKRAKPNSPGTRMNISKDMKLFLEFDKEVLAKQIKNQQIGALQLQEDEVNAIAKLMKDFGWKTASQGRKSDKEKTLFPESNKHKKRKTDVYAGDRGKEFHVWKVIPKGEKVGEGIVPRSNKAYPRQAARNAYKMDGGGNFGKLHIDPAALYTKNKLVVRKIKGGKLIAAPIIKKNIDHTGDLISLLTKRYNPKYAYSAGAIETFRELVKLAELPPAPSSGKSKLLGADLHTIGKTTANKIVKVYTTPDELTERLQVLAGSISAGNNSPVIVQEMAEILDALLRLGVIDENKHSEIYKKYIS